MRRERGTRRRLSVPGSTAGGHWKVLLSYSVLTEYARRQLLRARRNDKRLAGPAGPVFTMAGTLPPTSIPSRLSPTNVELPCVTPLRC